MAPSVPLPGTLNPLGSRLAPGSWEQLNLGGTLEDSMFSEWLGR